MATVITVDDRQVHLFHKRLVEFNKNMEKTPHQYAKELVKSLRRQLISQTKLAPRTNSARQIHAVKQGKFKSVVKMPMKLVNLDGMSPHYVSLKRGRAITAWAQKYYRPNYPGGMGKSRVRRGPRGGVKGSLYVTPDPFIEKAILRKRNWLTQKVNRETQKLIV